MTKTSQYPYSLGFSLGTILLLLLLMVLIFGNVSGALGMIVLSMYGFGLFIFLFMLALLVVKRLIPAIKGDIALGLDEEGINDYIRGISINWVDIKEIRLIRGRSASVMQIDLKWESDYGEQINIPLRWIKGKDAEIYAHVLSCLTANAGGSGGDG
jgi:hypothetical protein